MECTETVKRKQTRGLSQSMQTINWTLTSRTLWVGYSSCMPVTYSPSVFHRVSLFLPLFIFYVVLFFPSFPLIISLHLFISCHFLFQFSVWDTRSHPCLHAPKYYKHLCLCVNESEKCLCVSPRLRWISILISTSVSESSYCKGGQKGHFTTCPSPCLFPSPSFNLPFLSLWDDKLIISLMPHESQTSFFLSLLNSQGGVYLSFNPPSPHTQRQTHFSVLSTSPFTISVGKINVFSAWQGSEAASTGKDIHTNMCLVAHTHICIVWMYTHAYQDTCAHAPTTTLQRRSSFLKMFCSLQIQYWWTAEEEGWRYWSKKKEENRETHSSLREQRRKGCILGNWLNEKEYGLPHFNMVPHL